MSDLTPKGTMVNVDGVERCVLFTFSVIDEMQTKFNKTMDEIITDYLAESVDPSQMVEFMKTTSEMMEILANNNSGSKPISHGHFDNFITSKNVYDVAYLLLNEYGIDMPDSDNDGDEEEEKN